MSTLLQDAVKRAARDADRDRLDLSGLRRTLPISPMSDDEDNTLTTVHTPSLTPATGMSKPNSPPDSPRQLDQADPAFTFASANASGSPTKSSLSTSSSIGTPKKSLKEKREAAARQKASSLDPLKRFPNELTIRIFELIGLGEDGLGGDGGDLSGVRNLLHCGLVSSRWRRSATVNYVWFKLCQFSTFESTYQGGPPTWSRSDAKVNWCQRYRSINRRDDLDVIDALTADHESSGIMTPKEEREAKWKEEADAVDAPTNKAEMRAYYKEMGGRKAKNKSGKGAARDVTGWDEF